jgi:hypothetical protein
MANREIIERVKQLHEELKSDPTNQDVTRQLGVVLLEPDHAPHYRSLADKLLALEADHPKLAASIQQLVELLTSAGL